MRQRLGSYIEQNQIRRDVFGLNPIVLAFQTAQLVVEEIGLKRDAVLAVLLHPSIEDGHLTIEEVGKEFGDFCKILQGF